MHRLDQARTYFLSLFEAEPGNGEVNLELGRLSAEAGDLEDAMRFFHGAIFGVWPTDAAANRLEARMELVEFLASRRDYQDVRSELLATTIELPKNTTIQDRIAGLFVRCGDYESALDLYQRSLRLNKNDLVALRGGAIAAFRRGEYETSKKYFDILLGMVHQLDPEAETLRQTLEYVLELDPYGHNLSRNERLQRTMQAFQEAGNQIKQCQNSLSTALATDSGRWSELEPRMNMLRLRKDPALSSSALQLISDIEQNLGNCGQLSPMDLALSLIFRSQEGIEQ